MHVGKRSRSKKNSQINHLATFKKRWRGTRLHKDIFSYFCCIYMKEHSVTPHYFFSAKNHPMTQCRDLNLGPILKTSVLNCNLAMSYHSQPNHKSVDNKIRIFFTCSQKRNYYYTSAYKWSRATVLIVTDRPSQYKSNLPGHSPLHKLSRTPSFTSSLYCLPPLWSSS